MSQVYHFRFDRPLGGYGLFGIKVDGDRIAYRPLDGGKPTTAQFAGAVMIMAARGDISLSPRAWVPESGALPVAVDFEGGVFTVRERRDDDFDYAPVIAEIPTTIDGRVREFSAPMRYFIPAFGALSADGVETDGVVPIVSRHVESLAWVDPADGVDNPFYRWVVERIYRAHIGDDPAIIPYMDGFAANLPIEGAGEVISMSGMTGIALNHGGEWYRGSVVLVASFASTIGDPVEDATWRVRFTGGIPNESALDFWASEYSLPVDVEEALLNRPPVQFAPSAQRIADEMGRAEILQAVHDSAMRYGNIVREGVAVASFIREAGGGIAMVRAGHGANGWEEI